MEERATPPVDAAAVPDRPPPLTALDRKTHRILCVEDNVADRYLFKQLLLSLSSETPVRSEFASSVAQAARLLESGPFDVIFLDLSLGSSRGLDTLKMIQISSRNVPIIVLSGLEDRTLALELIRHGAQDFLPKEGLTAGMVQRSMIFAMERQRVQDELVALNNNLMKANQLNRSMELQLIQADKMESLGRLAAGIAHEVKNPLGAILQGSQALVTWGRSHDAELVATVAEKLKISADRACRIIQGMLDFSRDDQLERTLVAPHQILERVSDLCRHDFDKAQVTLRVVAEDDLPPVLADAVKLEQVVINLLLNALHAVEEKRGEVSLGVSSGVIGEVGKDEGGRRTDRLRRNDCVVVFEIRDNGPGIPQEKLPKIFDPFFTTKPTGRGTGLGLSVAKKIVNLHGGEIEVENVSSPVGCRARVFLKAVPDQPMEPSSRHEQKENPDRG